MGYTSGYKSGYEKPSLIKVVAGSTQIKEKPKPLPPAIKR